MKYHEIVFLLLFLGLGYIGNGQTNPDSLYNEAIKLIRGKDYISGYEALTKSAFQYHEKKQWTKANTALKYITRIPIDSTLLSRFSDFVDQQSAYLKDINPNESVYIHSFIGSWYARNGMYSNAMEKFKYSADKLYELNDTTHLHYVYYWLGQTYSFAKSNGAEALVYFNQAERVFELKKEQDSIFIGKLHYLKGIAYQFSDLEKSIENFKISQKIKGDKYGSIENLITKSLLNLNRSEEAYLSALKASKVYFDAIKTVNGEFLIFEALALNQLDRNKEACAKMEDAIKYIGNIYADSESEYYKVYYYKARILKDAGRLDEALDNCQRVFSFYYPFYTPKANTDIPNIDEVTPSPRVLDALKEVGEILTLKYHKTKETKYLKLVQSTYQKVIRDIETRRNLMENWDSKEQYNQFLYDVYEDALIASALLYQTEKSKENKNNVFYFLEKSKATLLQEVTDNNKNRKNIPAEILDQENEILKSISHNETLLLKAQSQNDKTSYSDLQNELFDIRQSLSAFRNKNSSYYGMPLTQNSNGESVKIVEALPNGIAILAHHLSEKEILCIGFDNEQLIIQFEPRTEEIDNSILKMRNALSDWNSILSNRKSSENTIKNCAKLLSTALLKPLVHLSSDPDHIVLMPNGSLHNIPFELLPTIDSDTLLIQKYDISYAYLFTSLPNAKMTGTKPLSFAGFAPKYNKNDQGIAHQIEEETVMEDSKLLALRSGLIDIPEARKNVSTLAKKYNGISLIDDQATKENFISEAGKFDVLHLGMHSLLNEKTSSLSSLVFSGNDDNELYLREIQSMDIPASLVVLSACNTGVGRNIVGEGSFSLARAFFYAGAQSTLMSLWQVPDVQTSRLMQLFYANLEKGLDKSQALSQAKRDYLHTATVLESHPSFWSGFVLVGDITPMVFEVNHNPLIQNLKYPLIALLLGILIWAVIKKTRIKK